MKSEAQDNEHLAQEATEAQQVSGLGSDLQERLLPGSTRQQSAKLPWPRLLDRIQAGSQAGGSDAQPAEPTVPAYTYSYLCCTLDYI